MAMKKLMCFVLVLCLILSISTIGYAERVRSAPLYLEPSVITGISYLINGWNGINFTGSSASGLGYSQFMQSVMSDYALEQGSGFTEYFAGSIVRDVVGNIVVAQDLYNKVKNFGSWLCDKLGLSNSDRDVAQVIDGNILINDPNAIIAGEGEIAPLGFSFTVTNRVASVHDSYISVYYNGDLITELHNGIEVTGAYIDSVKYNRQVNNNVYYNIYGRWIRPGGATLAFSGSVTLNKTLYSIPEMYYANVENGEYNNRTAQINQQFMGNIYGSTGETVNDFISELYNQLLAGTLAIDGVIVDTAPAPTPGPVPPSPYPQAQTELDALNTNIDQMNDALQSSFEQQQQFSQMLENQTITNTGINDLIGANHDILEGVGDIAGTLDGIQEQTESIEGTLEGIETATGTIADSLDVIGSADASGYKFDLRTLFPFCVPFDVVRILRAFDATTRNATAPHIRIPMDFGSVIGTYTWDFDFAIFEPVAAILRQAELLVFAVGLAIATNKMIRW